MTCRGTTEASSSRPDRQRPTTSMRRHRAALRDHFEATAKVEDVAPTHDSNVEAEVEDVATTHDSNIMVSTFFERWHPKTNTFHISFGEMTITLDDVSSSLGIPVSGAAVAPLEDDNNTNFELLVNYLGVTDEEATQQLHQYNDECLAWLYGQLGRASRFKVKQIAGYMTLLEAWVYEHMHCIVVPNHDLDYLEVQPRALRWIPSRDNGTTSVDVQKYRQQLDALNDDQVCFSYMSSNFVISPFASDLTSIVSLDLQDL
ncbi:hypothetical protein L3X38_038605 [Prunus dulcis]|uniref:Aminotransferase-like plant mobile domain-containing protein n=1 Tax=Prunus dulcis TaxID=3755 RepID=A0AAD4V763_PRUDU|nr:hypothetical protein L3X38_038605 [Prunus dulcis]